MTLNTGTKFILASALHEDDDVIYTSKLKILLIIMWNIGMA